MPRQEFIDLVKNLKKNNKGKKMSKRDFLWLFDWYQKRTSGNVWRINEYLKKEKMVVVPSYQNGWIDELIELKPKDKLKIKNGENHDENIDPINRLSILEAASKKPISISRDAKLEKAYHLMWQNNFSQLPIMNNEREVLGIITWESIAKGLITKKESQCVKDFMSNNFKVLKEDVPLFDAIKDVINSGVVFVQDSKKIIKGPITPSDLNKEFIEQIEPFLLLEQIENFIRLILHNKIVLEDMLKLIHVEESTRTINSISDLTFGEYIRIFQNEEMWKLIALPFDRVGFVENLDKIRKIRNGVMHFHPDKLQNEELCLLRNVSKFLENYLNNR